MPRRPPVAGSRRTCHSLPTACGPRSPAPGSGRATLSLPRGIFADTGCEKLPLAVKSPVSAAQRNVSASLRKRPARLRKHGQARRKHAAAPREVSAGRADTPLALRQISLAQQELPPALRRFPSALRTPRCGPLAGVMGNIFLSSRPSPAFAFLDRACQGFAQRGMNAADGIPQVADVLRTRLPDAHDPDSPRARSLAL